MNETNEPAEAIDELYKTLRKELACAVRQTINKFTLKPELEKILF